MSAEIRKLPVFETVGQSISFALRNLGLMVRLSWLWVVVMVVFAGILIFVLRDRGGQDSGTMFGIFEFMAAIAVAVLYVAAIYAIAVGWHRALLLGERPGWFRLRFGRRELTYLGYAFAVGLVSILPIAAGFLLLSSAPMRGDGAGAAATFVVLLGVLAGAYLLTLAIASRLFLVLPGAAVGDRRLSLSEAYALTRGNTWRIIGGYLLITLLNIIPNLFTPDLDPSSATGTTLIGILFLVPFLLSVIVAFVAVSYMSYCYWFFVPAPDEGDLA